jgi:hypothetical protein
VEKTVLLILGSVTRTVVRVQRMRSLPVRILLLVLASGGTARCGAAEPTTAAARDDVAAARRRADEAADLLMKTLMSRLQAALDEGGPEEAVRVCSTIAQTVTEQLGKDWDVVVRRTSLKTRNPVNAPDAYERAWLERAEREVEQARAPTPTHEVQGTGAERELRAMRPILFPGGICSQCHGSPEEISPEVRALLAERYPRDQAVGFRPGDLRGAISVRVGLAQAP